MGGAALHFGNIAEMKTGEGKTLVATLPPTSTRSRARASTSSRSTTTWLLPRRVDGPDLPPAGPDRRPDPAGMTPTHAASAYACDITYGTNNEFGFDFLRDNWRGRRRRCVSAPPLRHRRRGRLDPHRRGPDPADHLRAERRGSWYDEFAKRRRAGCSNEFNYEVDAKSAPCRPRAGHRAGPSLRSASTTSTPPSTRLYLVPRQRARGQIAYLRYTRLRGRQREVVIVDEFTGRRCPAASGRTGCTRRSRPRKARVQRGDQPARRHRQDFFLRYKKLAGMTGTAVSEARGAARSTSRVTSRVPTNCRWPRRGARPRSSPPRTRSSRPSPTTSSRGRGGRPS